MIMLLPKQISSLSELRWKLAYTVFAWLTLYTIELENVVCIVRPLNNVFFFLNKGLIHCK
jgi:hypothetical protein